jgi:hypothetical protein
METGPELPWNELSAPAVPVSREVRCEIGFVAARLRLLKLIQTGFLHSACALACQSALADYHGRAPRRLARPPSVSIAEPESAPGVVAVPLCWGTDLGSSRPSRVLEAELAFRAAAGSTAVRIDGVFRLPAPHHASPAEDAVAAARAAQSGAESLLTHVAKALLSAGRPDPAPRPGWRWITPDSLDLPRSTPLSAPAGAGLPIRRTAHGRPGAGPAHGSSRWS